MIVILSALHMLQLIFLLLYINLSQLNQKNSIHKIMLEDIKVGFNEFVDIFNQF